VYSAPKTRQATCRSLGDLGFRLQGSLQERAGTFWARQSERVARFWGPLSQTSVLVRVFWGGAPGWCILRPSFSADRAEEPGCQRPAPRNETEKKEAHSVPINPCPCNFPASRSPSQGQAPPLLWLLLGSATRPCPLNRTDSDVPLEAESCGKLRSQALGPRPTAPRVLRWSTSGTRKTRRSSPCASSRTRTVAWRLVFFSSSAITLFFPASFVAH